MINFNLLKLKKKKTLKCQKLANVGVSSIWFDDRTFYTIM